MSLSHRFEEFSTAAKWIRGAVIATGVALVPASASAFMRTVSEAELAPLEVVEGSGYSEHFEHPNIGNFEFTSIYLAPVANEVEDDEIYIRYIRPEYYDELAVDFHERLSAALAPTGLIVDTPNENSLIIETSMMEIGNYEERTTGTNISSNIPQNRIRGGAIMEMRWYAENGQTLVLALRDGRGFNTYDPVIDRGDRFTDAKDVFDMWAIDLAGFFGVMPEDTLSN